MRHEIVNFTVPGASGKARLTCYIPDVSPEIDPHVRRPTVIICPGGGYHKVSERESEPVALCLAAMGCNAYVLRYHVAPDAHYPIAQLELAWAIRLVRMQMEQIHGGSLFVLGFSAGGHLAGSLGVCWHSAPFAAQLGLSPSDIRPDGMVLCYPVVTSGAFAHQGSIDQLLGAKRAALEAEVSLENHVTSNAVPAYIWHTATDETVPVENSLLLARALRENHVPVALHIYPHGVHGLSLASILTAGADRPQLIEPTCQGWVEEAVRFMQSVQDSRLKQKEALPQ